jgi:hypothetical protein
VGHTDVSENVDADDLINVLNRLVPTRVWRTKRNPGVVDQYVRDPALIAKEFDSLQSGRVIRDVARDLAEFLTDLRAYLSRRPRKANDFHPILNKPLGDRKSNACRISCYPHLFRCDAFFPFNLFIIL